MLKFIQKKKKVRLKASIKPLKLTLQSKLFTYVIIFISRYKKIVYYIGYILVHR